MQFSPVPGESKALPKRCLSEDSCAKWLYQCGTHRGKPVQIANYRDDVGLVVAQKIRTPGKDFTIAGDAKAMTLYGKWLWRDSGKRVVITEGEIDAISLSQAQGHKWPVVSIPNGASNARKAIQKDLEWLEKFEEVVLLFDNDEPGQKAAAECAPLFTPGKCKIAKLPLKDANDMLVAGREKELIDSTWNAKTYRPDGIVAGTDLWDLIVRDDRQESLEYPWQGLQRLTHGLRQGELVTLCAGSGIGKSQVARELAYHLLKRDQTVGYIALEESTKRTALGLMGLDLNRPLHLNSKDTDELELKAAFDRTVGSGKCYLYDHFGSCDSQNLLLRIRYLARGLGCSWIILDHISIVVSGIGDGDERRLIDNTMTMLRSLVQELGIGLVLISHLKRVEGNKGHEEGIATSLSHLRGSAAIGQLSDLVLGLERDQQSEEKRNLTTVRVLKNRFTGMTGVACQLRYDTQTGRLTEVDGECPFAPEASPSDF